jgi:TPR repeat protein
VLALHLPANARMSVRQQTGCTSPSACEDACNTGELASCTALAVYQLEEKGSGAVQPETRDLFLKACDGGHAEACVLLGDVFQFGKGVDRDPARATELYQRACDTGLESACAAQNMLAFRERLSQ